MQIVRYKTSSGDVRVGIMHGSQLSGHFATPGITLHDLLRLRIAELRSSIGHTVDAAQGNNDTLAQVLAPIDGETEVWAAGVTYKRSVDARVEESNTPDIYTRVYMAARPELFFKGQERRIAGPDEAISVRADSVWNVPEPELALVINSHAEIVGYTIANDVSSRSIEGENPLYLPQAKVYTGSCALGPGIVPAWEVPDPYSLTISMTIERDGQICWQGQTSTSELKRHLDELVEYLYREDEFPAGAILCTGTALVPDPPFTLQAGDVVQISIDHLGTLRNPVVQGKTAWLSSNFRTRRA
jgi:2-dehydro-3-deoxy-D-arabinonate dehydratase